MHSVRKLLRETHGSATEYALFLSLVIGAATFGADALGLAVRKAFADAAAGANARPRLTAVAATAPVVKAAPDDEGDAAAVARAANDAWVQTLQLCVIGVALVGGGIVWYCLYVRNTKPKRSAEHRPERQPLAEESVSEVIFRKRQDILRTFEADLQKLLCSNVQVGHIMTRNVNSVRPQAKVAEVRELMQRNHMRHVLVMTDDQRLLGVISDRDFNRQGAKTASELMTPKPFTVEPSTLLSPAITLLVNQNISCLPVVHGEKLVGIFTTTDVLVTLQCALHSLQKASCEAARPAGEAGATNPLELAGV